MSENRLVEVAGHWLPRMEVAGIPSSTARSVMEKAGSWENWCRAWSAEGDRHEGHGDAALAAGHRVTAGEFFARSALFHHFGQFMFFDDPDQKAAATARKLAVFAKAAPLLNPPARPLVLPFEGGSLAAYLRVPAAASGDAVIIIPGSDSTKEEFPAFEEHFLKRGLATLTLDGPGQGEGRAHGPLRPDFNTAVEAAVAGARSAGISGSIGLVGMAFGGNMALRAASGVPEIAAVVSINGFHNLGAMWEAFPQVYRDNMRHALGGETAEDTRARAAGFTLAGVAPPACPAFVLHGAKDRIFPPDQARMQADWAGPKARLEIFEVGNHVCNNIPWLYRPMVADWLVDTIGGRSR